MNSILTKISNRFFWFISFGYKFLCFGTTINGNRNSSLFIGKNVKLKNVRISITENSTLIIGDNSTLENIDLSVSGQIQIGNNNFLYCSKNNKRIYIDVNGHLTIGDNNRLETNIRVRFGGKLQIGNFSNINFNSEIRCDESITIGDFNQISYNVVIWDTNTHNIYSSEDRRELTRTKGIGYEYEKPRTKPISIEDDCWIGRDVAILKGVTIKNKCIIGFRTLLSDTVIEENSTIVSDNKFKIIKNKV